MLKIIVIDDERLIMEIVKSYLEKDYEVLIASSFNDLLNLINENKVSAILSDFYMPDITGEEISLKLKEIGINIPIVLMSGSFVDSNQKATFSNFIKKPFKPNELLNILKITIGGQNV